MKSILLCLALLSSFNAFSQSPNVILIMTDDQGYGDLGFHGNPNVKTPNLDAFAAESIRMTDFYVSPVCAPTRSSLMTGRYSLRTGIKDTYNGGAIMSTDEVTLAELLKGAGYRTGIFGKWHLGDNYPSRPNDQGFDESVIHHSGGMGQVGDLNTYYQRDSSYFDPKLWKNGETQQYQGYCTDIFTNEAMSFIDDSDSKPFFAYIAYNAPHTPLQVPQKYLDLYADCDPLKGLENVTPAMTERNIEDAKKVYAMVSNIDDNVGKILSQLEKKGITNNTIVIFMTDNGPQQVRYVGGMKGKKGSVYRGGVRVPFFMRFPAQFAGNKDITQTAAHIDIMPTLANLCGFQVPTDRKIDGMSLVSAIKSESEDQDRTLFFTWTRKFPILYQNIALQKGPYRLVANCDFDAPLSDFELFNYKTDPSESNNITRQNKELVSDLKKELDAYYMELVNSPNLINPQPAIIGSPHQKEVVLNRNDAAGERGIWSQEDVQGYWNVEVIEGSYDIEFTFLEPLSQDGELILQLGTQIFKKKVEASNSKTVLFDNIDFPSFKGQFEPRFRIGQKEKFPFFVTISSQS